MAVARPLRLLGAVTILLILVLIFQFSGSPTGFPGRGKLASGMKKDPLLDRMLSLVSF